MEDDDGIAWNGYETGAVSLEGIQAGEGQTIRRTELLGSLVPGWHELDGRVCSGTPPPELRAEVKFFRDPSKHGIDGGRISKLTIQTRRTDIIARAAGRPYETIETIYNYDRGPDIDRLQNNPRAKRLYDTILRELN